MNDKTQTESGANGFKCYDIECEDGDHNIYHVGIMTKELSHAMEVAERDLLEGKHVVAKAIKATEVDRI